MSDKDRDRLEEVLAELDRLAVLFEHNEMHYEAGEARELRQDLKSPDLRLQDDVG